MAFGFTIRNQFDLLQPVQHPKSINKPKSSHRQFQLEERVQSRNCQSLGNLQYLVELDKVYIIKRHLNQLKGTDVSFQKPNQHVTWTPTIIISSMQTKHIPSNAPSVISVQSQEAHESSSEEQAFSG